MAVKVFVDARKINDGGIGTYIQTILDASSSEVQFTALVPSVSLKLAKQRWGNRIEFIADDTPKYSLKEYFFLARKFKKIIEQHDLYYAPHYVLPFFIPIPKVVAVFDAIHVSHPDSLVHKLVGRVLISSALRRADRVITISEHSKSVLKKLFGVNPHKIRVIHCALKKEILSNEEESSSSGGHVLFVGGARPHKGLKRFLKALELSEHSSKKVLLVGPDFDEVPEGTRLNVAVTSPESDEDLAKIYKNASLTVISSDEEGFGLVAIESLANGTPVVSTPLPSLKEACSKWISFSNSFAPEALAETINAAINSNISLSPTDVYEVRQTFTVQKQFDATLAVFQEMLEPGFTEVSKESRNAA